MTFTMSLNNYVTIHYTVSFYLVQNISKQMFPVATVYPYKKGQRKSTVVIGNNNNNVNPLLRVYSIPGT